MKELTSLHRGLPNPLSLITAIPRTKSDASVSEHNSESNLNESLGTKTPVDKCLWYLAASGYLRNRRETLSSAKMLVTSERNRLSDDIVKATKAFEGGLGCWSY
jgi:hypothetical protein